MATHLHSLPIPMREEPDPSLIQPRVKRMPSRSEASDMWALSTLASALLHLIIIAPMVYFGAQMLDADARYQQPVSSAAPIVNVAVKLSDFETPKAALPKVEPIVAPKVVEAKPEPQLAPTPEPKPKVVKTTPPRKTLRKRKVRRRRTADKAPDGRAQRILSKSDAPAPDGPTPSALEKAGQGAVGDGPPPPKVAGDPQGTGDGLGSEPATPKAVVVPPVIDTKKLLRSYLRKVARAVRKDFKYPRAAVRASMEGRAVVSITIDAEGQIVGAKLSRSSGYDILDKAAVTAAMSISKVPKAPAELEWSRRQVKIPFKFQLGS